MTNTKDFAVGDNVLVVNSTNKEYIGLYGYIAKCYNFKEQYVISFGTGRFYKVIFDQPVVVRGKTYKSGCFKKSDLNYAK